MKIALISDTHLGFGEKTERKNEAFYNALEAFSLATENKADLVLMPGDIFDSKIPSIDAWHSAFELFSVLRNAQKSPVKILRKEKELKFSGIPVIAIHGTHEIRSKDFKNPLQVLESAGFLFYVHAGHLIIENEKEKIAVHGLGGIPEKKALDVLKLFNPKPLPETKNILLMHQSIKEFLPTEDEMSASISISDLPKGFDLIVNGHLHWNSETKFEGGKLLIPGSTIVTQMKKLESKKPKGIVLIDSISMHLSFLPLKKQRKLFYEKISFDEAFPEEVLSKLKEKINFFLSENDSDLVPLIRIKLNGTLAKGLTQSDVDVNKVLSEFSGKAIFSIEKNFSYVSFRKKIQELRDLHKTKKSVSSLGIELLEKNLAETSFDKKFDVRRFFELLVEEDAEKVISFLFEEKN
jgi:DNA repair exonuclease SbcCD nuclease subunit